MKTSSDGIKLIKHFENCKLDAYKCPAGVWTIGYGHTVNVKQGDKITINEAELYLFSDLKRFESAINVNVLTKIDLTQNEFDALVSLCFNIGINNFTHSTLLRLLIAGNKAAAADRFLDWKYSNGKVLNGLLKRRKVERELFLSKSKWAEMLNF